MKELLPKHIRAGAALLNFFKALCVLALVSGCSRTSNRVESTIPSSRADTLAASSSSAPSVAPPRAVADASPPLTHHAGSAMKSYVTPYATPARSSLVRTARRPLVSMSRLSELQEQPWAVFVDPHVEHVVTTYRLGFDIWTQIGARLYRNREDGSDIGTGDPARVCCLRATSPWRSTSALTMSERFCCSASSTRRGRSGCRTVRQLGAGGASPRAYGFRWTNSSFQGNGAEAFSGKKTSKGPAAALSRRTAARSLPCLTDVSSSSTP